MAHNRQEDQGWPETCPELHEELDRLPERFRLPVLLCHLEGLSYEQAARQLNCPIRTVQSRLARARQRLRDRLTRRGLGPSVVPLAALLTPDAATAILSETWKHATVQAAVRYAAGGTAAAMIPTSVAALTQGALRAMVLHRLMQWAALLLFGIAVSFAWIVIYARSAPTESERAVWADPPDQRYRASFHNGASVEVVAVSTVPTGPHTWWRPDGSPLAEAPVDTIKSHVHEHEGETARVILVRVSGVRKDDTFRWLPTHWVSYWGGRPTKNGQNSPELDFYEATFRRDQAESEVQARIAAGPWTTEASNDGRGGTGFIQHGYKFDWGKARAYQAYGRSLTAISVAQNILGRDRRLIAIDRDGKTHTTVYSSGSGGGGDVLTLLDAEFLLPPEQIQEYRFQSRPFEQTEIKAVALNPRAIGQPAPKAEVPHRESRPLTASTSVDPKVDSDGDGLSDYQEIHKYRTDPTKPSTAGDGVSDGDWQRRREFTYTIRSVVKVMPPVNVDCLNDDYQDARVLSHGQNFVELEVIHYPLNTNSQAIQGNLAWRHEAPKMKDYLRAGITTNWDDAMRSELVTALKADGIDPDQLDDEEVVKRASAWLMANSKYISMFCTHYIHYQDGRAAIYPGLEAKFESDKGNRAWTVQEQLDHELFGRSMFAQRTHGSCTSTAVYLTTALRALGIPTRMVLGIPLVDGNDPAQLKMVRDGIHHHRVRQALLQGLSSAKGYANHTFNEVHVGGRWVRLNDKTLGQNSLDAHLMGLLTHVNTFNDLSEVPLAASWGKRYALGERDEVFRYGNPYRCVEVSDHFGRFAHVDNPDVKEHRAITISRAYWADDLEAHPTIKGARWLFHTDGSRSLLVHGQEWFEDWSGPQYRPFLEAAGREFVFQADGRPDVHGRTTTSSITWHSRDLHEIEVLIPREEFAKMEPGVEYTLTPRNEVPGYQWKIKGRVTIRKKS
jgi:hypothetical protein